MTTILINKKWNDEVLIPAISQFRTNTAREKVKTFILELLRRQREEPTSGYKLLKDKATVEVPARQIEGVFSDSRTRKKVRRILEQFDVVKKDNSWISQDLSDKLCREPRCNSWRITEPDHPGKHRIEVEYDEDLAILGLYKKEIEQAENKPVNATDIFKGKWAVEDYNKGKMKYADFIQVGRVAHNINKGVCKPKNPSARVYDAVALCKKKLRPLCFVNKNTGKGMQEIWDINAAIHITATIGYAGLYAKTKHINDIDVVCFGDYISDKPKDWYKTVFEEMLQFSKVDYYQTNRKWNKSARKTMKVDCQVVFNCDSAYLAKAKSAYECIKDKNVRKSVHFAKSEFFRLVRQYCIYLSIQEFAKRNVWDRTFFETIQASKNSSEKSTFYLLHTFGEKMLLTPIIRTLKDRGYTVHRVHDALWTTDNKLLALSEKEVNKEIGGIIKKIFYHKPHTTAESNHYDYRTVMKCLASTHFNSQALIDYTKKGII